MNAKVDAYLKRLTQWREESDKLRKLILDFELAEELKWGKPCYSFREHNVVLIQGFKNYCAVLFCKGALLTDPDGLLNRIGQNTQATRQARFASVGEIIAMEPVLRRFIQEAIELEKAGVEVKYKTTADFPVPEELQKALEQSKALKTAFDALTPGRQRGYLLHFSGAKQSKTRAARIEKWVPHILKGKGLDDE